ncbi:hypothetical protein [Nocardia alni]|uniref:hypothetical protein n=1 Tax=Nocardia alni TaxID=2815723 RepID=UPI001C242EC0|nr:hypothetical protein [Nocardia alni]
MTRNAAETRLTVGFLAAIVSRLGSLAHETATSEQELIRSAIVKMLDSFDVVGDINPIVGASEVDVHHISCVPCARSADFDALSGMVVHQGIRRRFIEPTDICIDAHTSQRLIEFCDAAGLSRARAIRNAVDQYLFDEVTGLTVSTAADKATTTD